MLSATSRLALHDSLPSAAWRFSRVSVQVRPAARVPRSVHRTCAVPDTVGSSKALTSKLSGRCDRTIPSSWSGRYASVRPSTRRPSSRLVIVERIAQPRGAGPVALPPRRGGRARSCRRPGRGSPARRVPSSGRRRHGRCWRRADRTRPRPRRTAGGRTRTPAGRTPPSPSQRDRGHVADRQAGGEVARPRRRDARARSAPRRRRRARRGSRGRRPRVWPPVEPARGRPGRSRRSGAAGASSCWSARP